MLKFLTSKFRNQSLNEVKPYDPQGILRDECDLEAIENSEEEDEELKSLTQDPPHINNNVISEETNTKFITGITLVESKENIPLDQDFKLSDRIDIDSENCNCKSGLRHRECNSAEKRKWSQISAHKLLLQFASNGTDSCSSDDEIKELCSQQSSPVFSSSPPNKVTRVAVLSKHSAFSARVRPNDGHMRKKHRLTEDDCMSRPSLNFEKMQQKTLFKKHSHSLNRPRIVRIKNITNSGLRTSTGSYNPAVLSFKPIHVNTPLNLAPVEEPSFVF